MTTEDYAPAVSHRLARFSEKNSAALAAWFQAHPVGTALALQLLEQLEDLAKKEGVEASDLLREAEQAFHKLQLPAKELGRRLRDTFEKRLHPFQQAHAAEFVAWTKRLGLPPGVQLRPPQNFEGEVFSLSVAFHKPSELVERLRQVLANLEQNPWQDLWKF